MTQQANPLDIAVVGMAGIFPGAKDINSFWQNIESGKSALSDVPPGRWDIEYYDPSNVGAERFYCKRGGFVDEIATFDAPSFGIMPVAIDYGEPDQFLTLKTAAEALEDAGGAKSLIDDPTRVGVILGRGGYYTSGMARLDQRVRVLEQVVTTIKEVIPDVSGDDLMKVRESFRKALGPEHPEAMIGLVPNLAASRIANRLDLQGPAYTVDAACASSLVAIDHATKELASKRLDVVITGGTNHAHDVTFWSVFTQLGALSPSETIRPFDRRADGLLIGEGTGIFVLERLEDAIANNHRVYAVIKGVGVASDGRDTSLMKPKLEGQLLSLKRAWESSQIDPASVGLIEAHGAGTPIGDRTELATLREFFGPSIEDVANEPNHPDRAVVGSVKSMIGHAMAAAGAAGMMKAILSLHNKTLPPTLNCQEPISTLSQSKFRVLEKSIPWESSGSNRIAGVSAFGFGGINAHVVLEESPSSTARSPISTSNSQFDKLYELAGIQRPKVTISPIRAEESGEKVLVMAGDSISELALRLSEMSDEDLISSAKSQISEVPSGTYRIAVINPNQKKLTLVRKIVSQNKSWRGRNDIWISSNPMLSKEKGGRIAFVFPGVEPTFSPQVDDVAELLGHPAPDIESSGVIGFQAAAIITVGRLLNEALLKARVRPDLVSGHSIGELTAVLVSGMIPSSEYDSFIASMDLSRVAMPNTLFGAVGASKRVAQEAIAGLDDVVVSHDNCPHQSIICGDEVQVRTALEKLRKQKVLCQELPFRSGFHSPMFKPYLGAIMEKFHSLTLIEPSCEIWSATICEPYPKDINEVRTLAERHLLEPVRFTELVQNLYEAGVRAFIQVGIGSLTGFVDDTLNSKDVLTLDAASAKRKGLDQLRAVLLGLWVEGVDGIDFNALIRGDITTKRSEYKSERYLKLGAPLIRLGENAQKISRGPVNFG
ncbi:MAG: acyltransferase domain-containing protein, partial [Acidimicrobiales bacterium]|nr:acyltransferase domain-containing protein [Acidimicrobiales bacterium]